MELGAIFVGLAMLVATIPFVVGPFQKKKQYSNHESTVRLNPGEQRQAVLSALRDLDFDFRTGKVSDEDYTALRTQLVSEAALYIQSEKSIEDDQLEAMIKARKASQSKIQECSHCGQKNEAGSRFCSQCGTAVGNDCPSCGKAVQAGDLFCTVCGTKTELKVEPVA